MLYFNCFQTNFKNMSEPTVKTYSLFKSNLYFRTASNAATTPNNATPSTKAAAIIIAV